MALSNAIERNGTSDVSGVDEARLASAIRALAMDSVQKANSGHPGMPMGMADAAVVLFGRHMTFDPSWPEWPDRDRFVLSVGHGSMLLYAVLHLTGYEDMTLDELKRFRQFESRTPGHPEYKHAKGIETTTGPLGQGLGNSVGMALAERHLAARFGSELSDHYTYVMAGDGCLMEGISHEAGSLAGHLRLGRLIVLYDDNEVSIDGPTSLAYSDDACQRFEAYGWHVQAIDGHDREAVDAALRAAKEDPRPSLISCRTIIGKGAPNKQGTASTHGSPLGDDEVAAARERLGWPYPAFEIPDDVRAGWRAFGARGRERRKAWEKRLAAAGTDVRADLERAFEGRLPDGFDGVIRDFKRRISGEKPDWATRKCSQEVLEVITPLVPDLLGGSADLTGSNNTKTKATAPITAEDYGGRYVHYGVREHGMAAAMNGMALHGGVIPYGGTFLVFTDYCRPSIRLSTLMKQRVVYVMTHDSIGLGEDGPTHQPIEHLAGLRAVPDLWVFRPADAVETAEAWALAVARENGPSVLALSRQNLPTVRTAHIDENLSARGGYVLAEADGERRATLLATGSEVAIALEARELLQAEGVPTAVVSMVCFELFDRQDAAYRNRVLGAAPRVAVEAAAPFGWTRYVADEVDVVGMTTFGASAPYKDLYENFGITARAVVEHVRARL